MVVYKKFLSQKEILFNLPPFNKSRLGGANDLGKQAFDPISNKLGNTLIDRIAAAENLP